MAYVAGSSGKTDVYVRRFTDKPASSVQVSTAGGHSPRWDPDGKQLFYRTDDWKLMAAPLIKADPLQFGPPLPLFKLPTDAEYEVATGSRFLVSAPTGRLVSPLMVIVNWQPQPQPPQ